MKEKILVTGGTGYIGSHTVVELQNAGYEVVIIDNLSNSSADVVDNIEKVSGIRPVFEKLDCLDYAGLDAVFAKYKGIKQLFILRQAKLWESLYGKAVAVLPQQLGFFLLTTASAFLAARLDPTRR